MHPVPGPHGRVWLIVCGGDLHAGARRTPAGPLLDDVREVVRRRPDAVLVVTPTVPQPHQGRALLVGWARTVDGALRWTRNPLLIDGLDDDARRTAVLDWLATARHFRGCPGSAPRSGRLRARTHP